MTKKTFFLVFFISIGFGCGQNKKDVFKTKDNNPKVTEELNSVEYPDLIEYKHINDTLVIISTDNFLYYPFGIYKSVADFESQNTLGMAKRIEYSYPYNDTTQDRTEIYRFMFNNSYIKFLQDPERDKLEVLSGKIFDRKIRLINGIKVGIEKDSLIKLFVKKIKREDVQGINVVELESGLTGAWQYYIFKNDTLNYFYFNTDYQLPKD